MAIVAADLVARITTVGGAAAAGEMSAFGGAVSGAGAKSLAASAAVGILGVGILGIGVGAVAAASQFEFSMQTIRAKIDNIGNGAKMTASEFNQMSQKALQLGRDTIFGANDAALGMLGLVKAGMNVKDIVGGGIAAVLNLAGAVDANIPRTANIIATAMNQFHTQGLTAAKAADVLTVATLKSGKSLDEFGGGLSYAGNIAATLGMSFAETAGTVAYLTRNIGDASRAGTGLRTSLNHLINPTKEAGQWMAANNIHMQDAQGHFVGMANLADQLKGATAGLSDVEKARVAGMLGGQRGQAVLIQLMRDGGDAIRTYTQEVDKNGVAQDIMNKKMDSLTGALHQLHGSIQTVLVIMGMALMPVVRVLTDTVTKLVNAFVDLPAPVQRVATYVLMAAGAVLTLVGGGAMMVTIFGAGMGTMLAALGTALGAVALPLLALAAAVTVFVLAWRNDWFGIQEKVASGLAALGPAIDAAGSAARRAADSVGEKGLVGSLKSVDWSGVAASWARGAADMVNGMVRGLHANWPQIQSTIFSLMRNFGSYFAEGITFMVLLGPRLIIALVKGLIDHWREIPDFLLKAFVELPAIILVGVATAFAGLGLGIIEGVAKGIDDSFPGLKTKLHDWFQQLIDLAKSLLGISSPSTVFLQIGVDMITGMANGLAAAWSAVTTAITDAIAWIVAQFADAGTWLVSAGTALLTGLRAGLTSEWTNVVGQLQGIPQGAVDAVGDLSQTLVNAGSALMDGLGAGIAAGWEKVKGFLGGLNPAQYKGPPERDRTMLIDAGRLIMGGLGDGLDAGWGAVARQLSGYRVDVAAGAGGFALAGAGGGGGSSSSSSSVVPVAAPPSRRDSPVINVFALAAPDLQRLMQAAQDGADLAHHLATEMSAQGFGG